MQPLWDWLANTEFVFQLGATWLFPFVESLHVLFVVTLVGSILIADLRTLGYVAADLDGTVFVRGLTRIAWVTFPPAVITGVLMFITRPEGYLNNPAFLIKGGLLVIAGLNVWIYYALQARSLERLKKYAAFASLLLWVGVIFAGRWIGHISR